MDISDFEMSSNFENGLITIFSLPHYRIPEGKYPFDIDTKKGILIIKRIKKGYDDLETLTNFKTHVSGEGSIDIIHDIYGVSAYSQIAIIFEHGVQIELTKAFPLSILNRLIRVYRCFTQQYWITLVPRREIYGQLFGIVKDKKFKQTAIIFGGDRGPQEQIPYFEIKDEKSRLNLLTIKEDPPLYLELIMNAREWASKEDYRLCVLEIFMALESFLYNLIREKFRLNGISDKDIKARFKNSDIGKVLHIILKEAIGKNIKDMDPNLWSEWNKNKIPMIRNDIVHRGRQNISEKEANMVYLTIMKIIILCENFDK